VLKLSSNVRDVFPKVLKLSCEVSECKPLHIGLRGIPLALDMSVEDIAGMTQGFTVGTSA